MIETRALRYQYPVAPAVAATSAVLVFPDLDLPQGGTLLLRGNSGSGKSTWLALVAGLLTARGGSVVVAGQNLGDLKGRATDAWRARALGFLPQKLHLSDALTVADNLALAYFAAGLPRDAQAIGHALARLGLQDLALRKPSQLSGGQAQRVALARAVLLRPQIILADEPTASLDDDSAQAALALLTQCAAQCQASLVIATHDARVASALTQAQQLNLSPSRSGGENGEFESNRPPAHTNTAQAAMN